ncbi:vomeronasal type-2 receptor 116-like [Octodon degus]|uniref:Vomeronasal type-2 receptor 116-like n=1 Tax=Octodon degus TaxID=10160 RepID=A0A6P3FJV4_OCTDE|nr:vomeronasal type-2 receptor 116-like [Octodon degus]
MEQPLLKGDGASDGPPESESLPALVCTFENEGCLHLRSTSVQMDGDVVIGCFLSLYYYIYYTGVLDIKPITDFYFIQFLGATDSLILVTHKVVTLRLLSQQLLLRGSLVGALWNLTHRKYLYLDSSQSEPQKGVTQHWNSNFTSGNSADLVMHIPNIYQNYLAFTFAIEEINRNPHLLLNITLGYKFHNFIYSHWRMLENSFILLTGQHEVPNYMCGTESKCAAVLMEMPWGTSAQIGPLLELYRFPQVTFGSFDPTLMDTDQYPSLHQVAPKDTYLALAMVSLMLYFHWTWVGLLITEGHKGLQFLSDVRAEMDRNKVCVAFVKIVSTLGVSYLLAVKKHEILTTDTSSANVVVIYYDTDNSNEVNYNIVQSLVTWKVWVTNSQWHADLAGRDFILDPFHGILIFSHHHEEIAGFDTFVQEASPFKYPEDTYLVMYWYKNFDCLFSASDCALKNCTPNASMAWLPPNRFDTDISDRSFNIYNAVYSVAHAIHAMFYEEVQRPPLSDRKMMFSPWQLHSFLKYIQFNNSAGDQVNLDHRRKLDLEYDILNFWNFPEGLRLKVKLGTFSSRAPDSQNLTLSEDMIEWATGVTETPHSVCSESCNPGFRKSALEGKAACCFHCTSCAENEITNVTDMEHCVKCPDAQYANMQRNQCLRKAENFLAYKDPLGKVLAGIALTLTVLTASVLGLFVKHRDTPIVKANNQALSYTLLISLTCCFLCSLLFIGRPNTATCILQQTTFGVVFTVAVSTVLAKTVTVVLAFKVTGPGRKMRQWLVSGAPNYIIPICSLIQLTLCGIWMGTNPPYIDTDAHSEHGHIIIMCNKGSLTAFYCVLGYLGSLALVSFTVAFLARNLPDTFNEAKFLTFSMLVFCSVWLTFLPVYHNSKGKAMVAMEVFSILASSAGLLDCIFVPKCYIIILRPERNSLSGFKSKTHSGAKTS